MMNNNKILTVSYGTFSCTLEGFDDSFDTMKAIAEYFRDLAADDRYFGAEPPQPDADQLARIAEREVSRRVEAREHEGRIMLKAHDESVAPTPSAATAVTPVAEVAVTPAEQPQAFDAPYTSEPEAPVPAAPLVEAHEPQAPVIEEALTEEPIADDIDEFEHETEEEVATEEAAAAFFADSPSVPDFSEENEGGEALSVEDFTNFISPAEAEEADAETVDAADGAEALFDLEADVDEPHMTSDDPFAEIAEEFSETYAAEEPVAAAFEEGIVEEAFEAEQEVIEETQEPVAEDAPAIAENDDEATADEVADEMFAEEVIPASDTNTGGESFADKLQRIRAVVSRQDETDAENAYEEEMDTPTDSVSSFEEMSPLAADASEMDETSETEAVSASSDFLTEAAQNIEAAIAGDDAESSDEVVEAVEADELDRILSNIEANTPEPDAEKTDETEIDADYSDNIFGAATAETVEVQGRILKVNRSALDAAIEAGELEEYEDDTLADAPALSMAEEQELQNDLAQLEAEEESSDADDAKPSARESLPEIDETDSEDLSRLMAEADQHMDEPEGKTRRSAFAHLRAAVAARFADRSMDKDVEKEEEEEAEAYRSDLAEVVKPRRPAADTSARAADSRPAPLKLVAEQRIDGEDFTDVSVAPRRVAAAMAEELILEEETGFGGYAKERGAETLPELLEAAAAYLCHVEGLQEFTRPQLMSRIKQADCGEFSREEGLRSFGQLLRTGKIEKVKGGRFVASEAIGFKPGHRAVG